VTSKSFLTEIQLKTFPFFPSEQGSIFAIMKTPKKQEQVEKAKQ
jgi:hypothetical protein